MLIPVKIVFPDGSAIQDEVPAQPRAGDTIRFNDDVLATVKEVVFSVHVEADPPVLSTVEVMIDPEGWTDTMTYRVLRR